MKKNLLKQKTNNMEFKINVKELKDGLKATNGVINKNHTLPVLQYVLFEFTDLSTTKVLNITGSDLENTVVYNLGVSSSDKCETFLMIEPHKLLQFISSQDNNEMITFTYEKDKHIIDINILNDKITLPIATDIDKYPKLNNNEDERSLEFNYAKFYKDMHKAKIFVANDELRPVMNSINLDNKDGIVRITSTDSNALYSLKTDYIKVRGGKLNINIPTNFVKNLPSSKDIGDVKLIFDKQYISLSVGKTMLFSKLTEGNYPGYRSVIPEHPFNAFVDRQKISDVFNKAALFSNEASNLIKLEIKENILVSSANIDFNNSYNGELDHNGHDDDLNIGVKGPLFISILDNLKDNEEINIHYNDEATALLLNGKDVENELFLIMPMMIH